MREFGGAELGDRRLNRRVVRMARAALAKPSASFPAMAKSDADLEGTYRFLNNPNVIPEEVLAPHVRRTAERCGDAGTVWVAHDTTDLHFGGDVVRKNLGRVRNKKQGFEAHMSIAIAPGTNARRMLGVLELQRINGRPKAERGASGRPLRPEGQKGRWLAGIESAEDALSDNVTALHLNPPLQTRALLLRALEAS